MLVKSPQILSGAVPESIPGTSPTRTGTQISLSRGDNVQVQSCITSTTVIRRPALLHLVSSRRMDSYRTSWGSGDMFGEGTENLSQVHLLAVFGDDDDLYPVVDQV